MESYALPIFRAGHIPMLGEWLALPLLNSAAHAVSVIMSPLRFSIRSPLVFWRSAMRCFGSADPPQAQMKWYA